MKRVEELKSEDDGHDDDDDDDDDDDGDDDEGQRLSPVTMMIEVSLWSMFAGRLE